MRIRINLFLLFVLALTFAAADTPIVTNGQMLASVRYNAAQTPVYIEIFPNTTYKPDEGNPSVPGTTAWAANQLSQGGTIFVHAGTYTVRTPITISNAGTTLACTNPASTVFQAANNLNSIMFKIGWGTGSPRQGMVVKDCGFNGNNGSQYSGTILDVRDTANALVEHNYIRFAKQYGLVVEATQSIGIISNHIVGNDIFECGSSCLQILNTGGSTTDNIVARNSIGGSVIGDRLSPWVYVTAAAGLQFIDNHISGTDHQEGLKIHARGQTETLIANNVIENVGGTGIYFDAYQGQIIGNNFYNIGTAKPGAYDMIDLDDAAGMLVSGNKLTGYNTTRDGVRIQNGTFETLVEGNVFRQIIGSAVNIVGVFTHNNTVGVNQYTNVGIPVANTGTSTTMVLTQMH